MEIANEGRSFEDEGKHPKANRPKGAIRPGRISTAAAGSPPGSGNQRDSFDQSIYAHSSPVYFACGRPPAERNESAQYFLNGIEDALKWIDTYGRYNTDQQREEVKDLFRQGREAYARLIN